MFVKNKVILFIFLGVLLSLPFTQVSAEVVWEEDFESGPFDDWSLQGYESILDVFYPSNLLPSITNGLLQMPNIRTGANWSAALRNCTIAYGTWSFDWIVEVGSDHISWDLVFFISDMPFNQSGMDRLDRETNGYILGLKSGDIGIYGDYNNSIFLFNLHMASYDLIGLPYSFSEPITGSHRVVVTRGLQGEFNVYFDSTLIITTTHTTTTTSERVVFSSWFGDSAFDNISVSSSVDPPAKQTPSFELEVLILALFTYGYYSRRRKR